MTDPYTPREPVRYYRLEDTGYSWPHDPTRAAEFYLVRKTPKGAWIVPRHTYARLCYPLEERLTTELISCWGARFVLDDDGPNPGHVRRYAYTTVEAAKVSYLIRKRWQIRHAENAITRAEECIQFVEEGERPGPDYFRFGDDT